MMKRRTLKKQETQENDILWVSGKAKKIYFKEHQSCLMLYFPDLEKMMEYMYNMIQKGYQVG